MSNKGLGKKKKDKNKGDKKQKEEKVEAKDVPKKLTPVVLSPFDELSNVWSLEDKKEQRKLIGELFEIEDGAGLSHESILLDLAYLDLRFAHESGFNIEQTKVFWNMMQTMQHDMADQKNTTRQTIVAFLKRTLLENSVYYTFFTPSTSSASILSSNSTIHAPSAMSMGPGRTPSVNDVSRSSSKASHISRSETPLDDGHDDKKKTKGKPKKKGKKEANPVSPPPPDDESSLHLTPKPAQLFTTENIKQITEYVNSGLLTHFGLYQCVLSPTTFQPRKALETHYFRLETIIPDGFNLADAMERTSRLVTDTKDQLSSLANTQDTFPSARSIDRELATADDQESGYALNSFPLEPNQNSADPVAVIVDQHVGGLKAEMNELLKESARMQQSKLDALMDNPPSSRGSSRGNKKRH